MEAVLVIVMIVAIDLAMISGLWVAIALCRTLSAQRTPADESDLENGDRETPQ